MENRIGKLIQAYDQEEGTVGLFRITEHLCPEDYIDTVIQEYFDFEEDGNGDLYLLPWGIERVYIDYEVNI